MKSPFPGMDPWLERHWGDVHHSLVQYARDALQIQLPEDLRARVEERVFVESEPERVRRIVPDVVLVQAPRRPSAGITVVQEPQGVSVAEPMLFEVAYDPVTEGFIEIRERGGGRVITVIEFLRPSNKSGGTGQEQYLQKQAEVLRSHASLVEIDLVRTGRRVLALTHFDIPVEMRGDCLACISPGWRRNQRELYHLPLREPLRVLPIPLRESDPRVNLDLQHLLEKAYESGRYGDDLDYSQEAEPPLRGDAATWAHDLLKAGGWR